MNAVRCFVGIPLPPGLKRDLASARQAVSSTDHRWRAEKWVAEENLHVTVKFLGNIDETLMPGLVEQLGDAVSGVPAFTLPLAGLRALPDPRRCRMLWLAFLDPKGTCGRLAGAVDMAAAAGFGLPTEERPFVPHATLCRARHSQPIAEEALVAADEALSTSPDSMSVPAATLFASRLTPRGPIYDEIATWHLRGE